jgi:hypothetical protein
MTDDSSRHERARELHAAEYPPEQGFRSWEELSDLVRELWLAKADGMPPAWPLRADACDDDHPGDYA